MTDERGRAEMSVDLDLFCDPNRCAPGGDLSVPFSLNGHTYATNGHICVRVLDALTFQKTRRPRTLTSWRPGSSHASSSGHCQSPRCYPTNAGAAMAGAISTNARIVVANAIHCNGSGKLPPRVRIGKAIFAAQYIEWIQALPGLETGKPKLRPHPLPGRRRLAYAAQ
jgi:hypothetical protein